VSGLDYPVAGDRRLIALIDQALASVAAVRARFPGDPATGILDPDEHAEEAFRTTFALAPDAAEGR